MKGTAASAPRPALGYGRLLSASMICYISIMFAGIASMLMSVYLPVAVRDLLGHVSDQQMNNVSAYINSFFIFGTMFGGFTWGFVCDRIGRSKAVVLSTAFYGLFTLATAFAHSWELVCIYRFLTGFGVGGVLVTTNIIMCELWPEKNRTVAVGIVSAAMPVGFIAAGAINNMFSSWQQGFLLGAVPVTVALMGYFLLPEPEEWKTNAGKSTQQSYAEIFNYSYRWNLLVGSVVFGTMLIGLWAVFSWAPTWVQSVTPDEEKAAQLRGLTMMILATSGLVGSIASGWIERAIGIRNTLMICFFMCFVMVFIVFKLNHSVTTATLAEMGILSFFFGISQGAMAVYIPHLFPVAVRASATGFCFNIGRLFTATVVFFIGALVSILGGYGNAIFIFSFIFLAGLVATSFSTRTYKTTKLTN